MIDLEITSRQSRSGLVLTLIGELDHSNVSRLQHAVRQIHPHPGQQLILDLSGLRFCDSSGIAGFLAARNRALDAGAHLVLAAPSASLMRVLTLIGLTHILPLYPTLADAEAAALHPVSPPREPTP